jgi:antitoxin ParD1/3/4
MRTRANKPISVTLGPLADSAERRVREGRYASVSEVVRAGLRALDREEAALDEILRAKVAESLADTRLPLAPEDVAAEMRQWHEARLKRAP